MTDATPDEAMWGDPTEDGQAMLDSIILHLRNSLNFRCSSQVTESVEILPLIRHSASVPGSTSAAQCLPVDVSVSPASPGCTRRTRKRRLSRAQSHVRILTESRFRTIPSSSPNLYTVVLCLLLMALPSPTMSVLSICQYYDDIECKSDASLCAVKQIQCPRDHPLCYASYSLWNLDGVDTTIIRKKGCWHRDERGVEQERCVSRNPPTINPFRSEPPHYFCCCEDDRAICNGQKVAYGENSTTEYPEILWHDWLVMKDKGSAAQSLTLTPSPLMENQIKNTTVTPETAEELTRGSVTKVVMMDSLTIGLVAGSIVFAALLAMILVLFIYRRYQKRLMDGKKPGSEDLEGQFQMTPLMAKEYENQDGTALLRNVQYIERKSTGRYGEVWMGRINEVVVAVKVTQLAELVAWSNEVNMYRKFLLNPHPNILRCLISSERVADGRLLLVTEYHPQGSLMEVLKGRVITMDEADKLMCTMLSGLAYLHDSDGKPSIAHRDLKSTNILVKDDGSACVADFGLATAFEPDERIGGNHGQVGTRRYMAPELLEGAISLNVASFLRVDIYACGLMLWEIISRTQLKPDEVVGVYKMPFEEELGLTPINEAVHMAIVHKRLRPPLKDSWRKLPGTSYVCSTIEECWDADPEARPSASCLLNRTRKSLAGDDEARGAIRYDDCRDSAYGSSPVPDPTAPQPAEHS